MHDEPSNSLVAQDHLAIPKAYLCIFHARNSTDPDDNRCIMKTPAIGYAGFLQRDGSPCDLRNQKVCEFR